MEFGLSHRASSDQGPEPASPPPIKAKHLTEFGPAVEQWRELVSRHFHGDDVETALRIIECESRGDPTAFNTRGSDASGLFQHLPKYWESRSSKAGIPGASIWDPESSTIVAAWLRYSSGWHHWTCY